MPKPSEGVVQRLQLIRFGIILEYFGPKAAQMLQMVSFDIALNHYGPKAVQMLLLASLRIILDYFGPRAAQMLEVISSGAILDHFGCPKKSTYFKWSALVSFWFQYSRSNPSKSIRIRQNPTRSADIRFGVFAAV